MIIHDGWHRVEAAINAGEITVTAKTLINTPEAGAKRIARKAKPHKSVSP